MRRDLIVAGVMLLVIGAILYFLSTQPPAATGAIGGAADNAAASLRLPVAVSIGSMILGLFLLVLGLVVPAYDVTRVRERRVVTSGAAPKRVVRESRKGAEDKDEEPKP